MGKKRYFMPVNFATEGYAYGNIKWRNLIEAMALAVAVGVPVFVLLPIQTMAKVYIGLIVILPAVIFAIVGVNGLSLSSFVHDFIETQHGKRVYGKPTNKDRINREKNLVKKKHKKIRQQQAGQKKQGQELKKKQAAAALKQRMQLRKEKKDEG